jgi:7-cyano-7-deazaguanine synthase
MKSVTILSGGMDSTTLVYYLHSKGYEQQLLSFNYGQRHARELGMATETAKALNLPHKIINLTDLTSLLKGSSLTDRSEAVPEGHYSEATMAKTVVPNRNAIMLSIAWGVAVAQNADFVSYGAHAGDHAVYPDCRSEFVIDLELALSEGNKGFGNPELHFDAPFLNMTKAGIVKAGLILKVPYENTWTCYNGGEVACGRCSTCVERLEAFSLAGEPDPIPYLDKEFWKTVVAEFESKKQV